MSETIRIGRPPAVVQPRRRRLLLWLFAAFGACVITAAAAVLILHSDTITVVGTVEIGGDGFSMVSGGTCAGDGGYSDIRAGAQVVVSDAAGTTVAVGHLGDGSWIGAHCELPFSVDVPAGSDFYGLQVASRNVVQYKAGQLNSPVVLSIGD